VGKYDPPRSSRWDQRDDQYRVDVTFAEIDAMVGGLPPSARTYPGWWSNEHDGTHVQARSWLDAGYTVPNIDLNSAHVCFDLARGGPES